ncbi:MAG TPA: hypothetical protein VKR59_06370 [Terriglobales bacterium]|nr:hypothetical protein [Terriglobales bacterium]
MHTTLQRCPLNSVEQLGQIVDASVLAFMARTGTGTPAAELGDADAVGAAEEIGFAGESIYGVVAQIRSVEEAKTG